MPRNPSSSFKRVAGFALLVAALSSGLAALVLNDEFVAWVRGEHGAAGQGVEAGGEDAKTSTGEDARHSARADGAGRASALRRAAAGADKARAVSQAQSLLDDPSPRVRLQALKTLRAHGGETGRREMTRLVSDPDPAVSSTALRFVVEDAGPQSVSTLAAVLSGEASSANKVLAIRGLVKQRNRAAIKALVDAAMDRNPTVALMAREQLAKVARSVRPAVPEPDADWQAWWRENAGRFPERERR